MHIFTILLFFGILHQQFTEGLHLQPHKPCTCNNPHKEIRIKRQISVNVNPNPPPLGTIPSNNNQEKNQDFKTVEGNESEIVGLAGLAHLDVLAARAKARAAVARVRARARLHRPLLLEPTPEEFLNDDDSQNNFPGPDSILSLNNLKPVPSEQNFDLLRPSEEIVDLSSKQTHHGPSSVPLHPLNIHDQRSNILDLKNSARSVENYEGNQVQPLSYIPQPEIRVHNIDNSEEVYQNRKPGFSIIPSNWKPPPDSNLYVQGDYGETDGQEPILAVLPGRWTDDDGYETYYYEDYDVIPISYNIPEEGSPNYSQRSADPEGANKNGILDQFASIKKQFGKWEENPMVWRPDSDIQTQQRAADPHFHHGHSHIFTHKHVLPGHLSGFESHSSSFVKPTEHGFPHPENSAFLDHQIPIQHSSFGHFESQGGKSGFSHQLSHGHSITINNQKTTVVVPPNNHQNVEIAQVTGTNNALSQSQASSQAHQNFNGKGFASPNSNFQSAQVSGNSHSVSQSQSSSQAHQGFDGGFVPAANSNFQSANVFGNSNSVSQSQRNDEAPFVGRESENLVGAPYLINVPRRSDNIWRTHNDFPQKFEKKRSMDDVTHKSNSKISRKITEVLKQQNQLLNEIQESAKDDKELIFLTEIGSNFLDNFEDSLKSHTINKRTVPILRLIADPNAKLDVPKTLENMGTVARNSFENKRAPMYHLKNFAGSAKDAFLSTLRIIPQDFIIPSRYKIIDREREDPSRLQVSKRSEEEVRAISPSLSSRSSGLRERIKGRRNQEKQPPVAPREPETPRQPEDPYNFSDTYQKIGSMFRESVQSGQDTLNHMGELYHSTRKALATARHSAPRVLLSSLRIPAVERPQPFLPHNNKLLMIAPKILQLKQESVGAPHYSETMDDMVGIGNVMDSLGISNPDAEKVGRRRIVLQPANLPQPKPVHLQSRSNFAEDIQRPTFNTESLKRYFLLADTLQEEPPEENIQETMDALNNAREAVGASSLRDFVVQMKNGLSSLFRNKLVEARDQLSESLGATRDHLDYQNVKGKVFLESKGKRPVGFKFKATNPIAREVKDEIPENKPIVPNPNESVGAGLLLPKRLATPFMGQPSKTERREFFEELGDSEELNEEQGAQDQTKSDDTVGAGLFSPQRLLTPFMGEPSKSESRQVFEELNEDQHKVLPNDILGAGLLLPKRLLTPFMGEPSKSERREFFEELGDSEELNEEQKDEEKGLPNNQEVIGGINPILFNKTFQLCDDRSPFEFLAALNASKHTNHTNGTDTKDDDFWKHECIYVRTTTPQVETTITVLDESSTTIPENGESTTNGCTEEGLNRTTSKSEEEDTTKKIKISNKKKNANLKDQDKDDVGTSMTFGKQLLTPFMGKPYSKEVIPYFDQYDEGYEDDEDGYLGERNPEELQALPNDGIRKKNEGIAKKNDFSIKKDPLELNHV